MLNQLGDLLALNICAQTISVSEITVEGLTLSKAEQSNILDIIIVVNNRATNEQYLLKKPAILMATLGQKTLYC